MKTKSIKWVNGKKAVASVVLVTTMLLAAVPEIYAEENQSLANEVTTAQSSTKETVTPNVIRYEGQNREQVAENVAKSHFSDSKKVIIVNRDKFSDAISATNISQGKYPVLYTREGRVSDSTLELLKAMALDEIYILGGEQSVNASVVKQLKETTGVRVTRIAGSNRYVANANAVEANYKEAKHVVIASGEVYSDALYGVSYANTVNSPVVLTRTSRLDASTIDLLNELNVESVTIIGGPVTVTPAVATQLKELGIKHNRIAGENRYIGSAEVAAVSYQNPENIVVASGEVFSDALVSAPLAQKLNAPILLVRKDRMDGLVEGYLRQSQLSLENIYIQGGPLTVFSNTEGRIKSLASYVKEKTIKPIQKTNKKFETINKTDNTLPEGKIEVIQEGIDGFVTIYYEIISINGKEVSRIEIDRKETAPVSEIIRVGSQVTEVIEETITETVDFETEEIANYNAIVGEIEVIQEGVNGESDNTYAVTYVNGIETERELTAYEVTTKPVNEIVKIGVLPRNLSELQVSPNGITIKIDEISYTEGKTYNTFKIEYTETNNTENRLNQESFKLYLTNGDNQSQYGFFSELMPGMSTIRSYSFDLLKSEMPQALEYGDVFFNTEPDQENPVWKFVN